WRERGGAHAVAPGDDAADRQVEQPARDEQGRAARVEPDERRLEQDVGQVARAPERGPGPPDREAQDHEHREQVLLGQQPAEPLAPRGAVGLGRTVTPRDRRGGRLPGRHESLPSSMRRTAARWAPSMLSAKMSSAPSATYW